MIDLILSIIFCYQLNRMARERGVASFPYIMNYVMAVVLMGFALASAFIYFYGIDALRTEQGMKMAMMFEPVAISFEVFLFIWFRNRIRKTEVVEDIEQEEDEQPRQDTPGEKKDLSYFR